MCLKNTWDQGQVQPIGTSAPSQNLTWPQQTLGKSQVSFHLLPPLVYQWVRCASPTRKLGRGEGSTLLPKQRPLGKPTRKMEGTTRGTLRLGICQPIRTFVNHKHCMCLRTGFLLYKIKNSESSRHVTVPYQWSKKSCKR